MSSIQLREVVDEDLPIFCTHQQDLEACQMAAFVPRDPTDREAIEAHWARLRHDDAVMLRTIVEGDQVVGHIASFDNAGQREVTYWVGREHWGRRIASESLRLFLVQEVRRPLYGSVAHDNHGSRRVLEKCGFEVVDRTRGFAHARGEEIEELSLVLRAPVGRL